MRHMHTRTKKNKNNNQIQLVQTRNMESNVLLLQKKTKIHKKIQNQLPRIYE